MPSRASRPLDAYGLIFCPRFDDKPTLVAQLQTADRLNRAGLELVELTGIEPATYALQRHRSPS